MIQLTLGFPCDSVVKNLPVMQEIRVWSLGCEDLLENRLATHFSILGASLVAQTIKNLCASACFIRGLPRQLSGKEPTCQCRRHKRHGFNPWVRKIPWRRAWQPTPVFLPGESHGQRSLAGYSPWDCEETDMTEAT